MKTVVFTSDTHAWLLRGFFHQWAMYGKMPGTRYENDPLEMEVAGFSKPYFHLDVPFVSIGRFEDYPVGKWSDAIIKYLQGMADDLFLFLLEDYWLIRPINRGAIFTAYGYMMDHPDILRFDMAADRMFNRQARYLEPCGSLDICEAKGDYSFSTQAGIFRRKLLLEILKPGETPWEAEINGSGRLNKLPWRVVGTYQWPVNYFIAMNKGKLDPTGSWMFPARTLKQEDMKALSSLGYLKPEAQD